MFLKNMFPEVEPVQKVFILYSYIYKYFELTNHDLLLKLMIISKAEIIRSFRQRNIFCLKKQLPIYLPYAKN